MGFTDWLRRLVGAGPARGARPEPRPVAEGSPIRRERDELTTFIALPKPPPVEKTEVASPAEPASAVSGEPFEPTPGLESTTVVDAASGDVPVSESEPSETTPIVPPAPDDADATLLLQPQPGVDPDATLYLEVPKRVVATLEAVKGELLGQTFELSEGENQLGRSPESDVVLASMWISREHAKIVFSEGRLQIFPLSDKISSVDGEPAQAGTELSDGCNLQLGGTVFRLTFAS